MIVLETLVQNPQISRDKLIKTVKSLKPKSKFNDAHVSWYKSKIKNDNEYRDLYNEIVKKYAQKKGREILSDINNNLKAQVNSYDEWFHANRFIYSRLKIAEDKKKDKIKKELYQQKPECYYCKVKYKSIKGIELHRLNENLGYHKSNCVLTCNKCHP